MNDHGLSKEELKRVLTFEGYGSKTAPYWFLGMEEGGGSMEELRERAKRFDHPVEDLCAALAKIGWGDMRRYVPTWRVMSTLIMAMGNSPKWQEKSSAIEYQATKLGRADGETFLTELMPLPCPGIKVWPYPLIFPSKKDYYAAVRPCRIKWLRSAISECKPPLVICYGKGNWRHHKEIFCDVNFRPELNGKICVGEREHNIILLIPFLSPDLVSTALITQIADMFGRGRNEG
tara:strand:- start:4412 stop:5110 length:699 start_codon:yes stop_codon:yes gene_type:complete